MTNLPLTHWDRESIRKGRLEKIKDLNLTPDQMLERLADLETALYPFVYVLGAIDNKSWRGTNVSSKLFPMMSEDNKFSVYKDGEVISVDKLTEAELHTTDYFEEDSIIIEDGTQLNDTFTLMATHQQAPGAYVGCGSIVMGDVRYAVNLLYPKKEEIVEPSLNSERRSKITISSLAFKYETSLTAACSFHMELGWTLSRALGKLMNEHGLSNLAFKYDFALNLSEDKS